MHLAEYWIKYWLLDGTQNHEASRTSHKTQYQILRVNGNVRVNGSISDVSINKCGCAPTEYRTSLAVFLYTLLILPALAPVRSSFTRQAWSYKNNLERFKEI